MNFQDKIKRYAFCIALEQHSIRHNGRLDGLLKKLRKEAERNLALMPRLSSIEAKRCTDDIMQFIDKAGWNRKDTKHAVTWANFVLAILEDAPKEFDRIVSILREIVDYFERAKTVPAPCYWSSARAAEVFLGGGHD
jgi:hypothetical protein